MGDSPLLGLLLMSPLLVSVTSDCYNLLISEEASAVAGPEVGHAVMKRRRSLSPSYQLLFFTGRK